MVLTNTHRHYLVHADNTRHALAYRRVVWYDINQSSVNKTKRTSSDEKNETKNLFVVVYDKNLI